MPAMIIMASASGTPVSAIARLVAADEGTVRDVVHLFDQKGLAALDPQWAGGCHALADDQLWGVTREPNGGDHTLAALKSIRARQPGGYRLYVILDNLSANKTGHPPLGRARQRRALLHPDGRILGQPDRGPVGPLRTFAMGGFATRAMPSWPASCRTTWPGATPTPAIPTSWAPSAANAPASAASASNAGDGPGSTPPDPVNVCGQRARREREGVRPLRITTG
jgi:hypothetical protein